MEMDPAVSTIERGNINILVWPVFGGMMGWLALGVGTCAQIRATDEATFKERAVEAVNSLWDEIDRRREDNIEQFTRLWVHKGKPIKYVAVPAAPPYLNEQVLERSIIQSYEESDSSE